MYAYGSGLGFLEWVFVGRTVLMLLYVQLVGAPGAVNIHYFCVDIVKRHLYIFIHSFIIGQYESFLFFFSSPFAPVPSGIHCDMQIWNSLLTGGEHLLAVKILN